MDEFRGRKRMVESVEVGMEDSSMGHSRYEGRKASEENRKAKGHARSPRAVESRFVEIIEVAGKEKETVQA